MYNKIKLLFLSASPGYLRSDIELRDIEKRIRSAPYGSAFEISSAWAVRPDDIADALYLHKPDIVHFSGHGEQESGIFLEDEKRRRVPLQPETVCRLFAPLRGTTRVVILNACETRPIAEALRNVVDYAISMRRPITDEAAITFASGFYSSLAHGLSVKDAFYSALTALSTKQIPEADIPDLVERPGLGASEFILDREPSDKPNEERKPREGDDYSVNISDSRFRDYHHTIRRG